MTEVRTQSVGALARGGRGIKTQAGLKAGPQTMERQMYRATRAKKGQGRGFESSLEESESEKKKFHHVPQTAEGKGGESRTTTRGSEKKGCEGEAAHARRVGTELRRDTGSDQL